MELVLELLVGPEVHVGRVLGALGSAAPLAHEDRNAAERRGVAAGALEVRALHRSRGQAAAVDVRREHHTTVVGERWRQTEVGVRPQDRRFEEHEVREGTGSGLAARVSAALIAATVAA